MIEKIANKMFEIKGQATKSQIKLIDYLINASTDEIIYLSITELSEITGVGEATILRFCRALGYKGYQDFKLDLAKSMPQQTEDKKESFIDQIASEMIETIELCKNEIKEDIVNEAASYIENSNRISIFGSGSSYIPARELRNSFLRIGVHAMVEDDPHIENILVSTFDSRDLLILFSVSGCSKDAIEVLNLAKERNVKTIIITSYLKSPMAKLADVVIKSVKNESPVDGGSTLSKIGQFYVASVIVSALRLRDTKKYDNNYGITNKSVSNKLI